jgi:hypothetical protein
MNLLDNLEVHQAIIFVSDTFFADTFIFPPGMLNIAVARRRYSQQNKVLF